MNAKIAVNLKNLKKQKESAEYLLEEMCKHKHVNVISSARAEANMALRQYTESYVISYANMVLKLCDELETVRNRAYNGLHTEIEGLGKVINGYLELESSFI